MSKFIFITGFLFAAFVSSCIVHSEVFDSRCKIVTETSGFIHEEQGVYNLDSCWIITVPHNTYTTVSVDFFQSNYQDCSYSKLNIRVIGAVENSTFCANYPAEQIRGEPIFAFNNIEVNLWTSQRYSTRNSYKFKVSYQSVDFACDEKGHFQCASEDCIPNAQVCDGFDDCPNGEDELVCELERIDRAEKTKKAVQWLMDRRSPSFGWRDDTHRAVTALYLATLTSNSTTGNGRLANESVLRNSRTENQLILRHLDLQTSLALLRKNNNKLSLNQLSLFVNALVVSCQDPRHFYGFDLVQMLQERLSSNILHLPVAYLALCNADEPLPDNATENLDRLLRSSSKYPFLLDVQASAVMAASCLNQRLEENVDVTNSTLKRSLEDALSRFEELQKEDGTFGNLYTTALITQALLSSGEYIAGDYRLKKAIQYLSQQISSASTDFLAVYLTLPLLNWKTMVDVHRMDCSDSLKPDLVTIAEQTLGPKMLIKYSLCVGDAKDLVHTLSMRVPQNISAFEVMQLAQAADAKYKFQWKQMGNQKYVYEIAKIINDSENGLFWLLYVVDKKGNTTQSLQSPEELTMQHGEQLIMWYKTAGI